MSIIENQTIWFPGIYEGRQGDYAKHISEVMDEDLFRLVQERAKEDGEWAIANGHVGENNENELTMRLMMKWVSDPNNIRQCFEAHIVENPTVDWICRDLANASKWIAGSRD
jgi:hypothetical protein